MRDDRNYGWRLYFVVLVLTLCFLGLIARLVYLSIFNRPFLMQQSDARAVRVISTPAYRGMITDRFGVPLAVSTPVDSVWVNPQLFQAPPQQLRQLAQLLGMPPAVIQKRVLDDKSREFAYLERGLPPDAAAKIKALDIPGLFFQREYRRYYPEGEVATHVIGFTNVDDIGQDGLELAYDSWLKGVPGKERVLKDRLGRTIAIMDVMSQPQQGHNLVLSLDNRIQYLAYRDLKAAVEKTHAGSGSVVVLNPKTGEILAMANVPSYNPNARPLMPDRNYRNRAATDVFEPGSCIKPFSVSYALESGKFTPMTKIDTSPGWVVINGHTIKDDSDNGIITVTQVLTYSSNVGVSKIVMTLPPQGLYQILHDVGFGQVTGSGFPGEVGGTLNNYDRWSDIDEASLSFGYSISVTDLQLAHAYSILADDGMDYPVTFIKQNQPPVGKQVIDPKVAHEVLNMLETVVDAPRGTAPQAAIPGYRIAGKTGTSYVAVAGGYNKKLYNATFAGIAPVSNPQLVIVVTLHELQGVYHFGGEVSAPVFANVMGDALRILDIPPDNFTNHSNPPAAGTNNVSSTTNTQGN